MHGAKVYPQWRAGDIVQEKSSARQVRIQTNADDPSKKRLYRMAEVENELEIKHEWLESQHG